MRVKYNLKKIDGGKYFLFSKDSQIAYQLEITEEGDRLSFLPPKQRSGKPFLLDAKDFERYAEFNPNSRLCYFTDKHLGGLAIRINKILNNANPEKQNKFFDFFYKKSPRTKKIYEELLELKSREREVFNKENITFN